MTQDADREMERIKDSLEKVAWIGDDNEEFLVYRPAEDQPVENSFVAVYGSEKAILDPNNRVYEMDNGDGDDWESMNLALQEVGYTPLNPVTREDYDDELFDSQA